MARILFRAERKEEPQIIQRFIGSCVNCDSVVEFDRAEVRRIGYTMPYMEAEQCPVCRERFGKVYGIGDIEAMKLLERAKNAKG